MILQNMDEALDIKPVVTIEGKQLELLKIQAASVGNKFKMECVATISNINQNKGEDGMPSNVITFELSAIEMEPEEKETTLAGMYPMMEQM